MVDYAIFGDCRLRGVGLVRGVSLPSPIHLTRRPYNAGHTIAVWPCDKRLRTRCYTVEANYRQTVEQPLYDIRASCLFFLGVRSSPVHSLLTSCIFALLYAMWTPKFSGWKSAARASHVCLCLHWARLGGVCNAASTTLWWTRMLQCMLDVQRIVVFWMTSAISIHIEWWLSPRQLWRSKCNELSKPYIMSGVIYYVMSHFS